MIFQTTDLCDEFAAELAVCQLELRAFGGRRRFSGPIATLRVYEDNVLVRQALETLPAGAVLVVDGGGSRRCALLGDMLAQIAVDRGLAGIVVNGCVRDSAALAALDVGVLALGTNPLKSEKRGRGEKDVPLAFGGVVWTPGAFAYADEDGLVLAPRQLR